MTWYISFTYIHMFPINASKSGWACKPSYHKRRPEYAICIFWSICRRDYFSTFCSASKRFTSSLVAMSMSPRRGRARGSRPWHGAHGFCGVWVPIHHHCSCVMLCTHIHTTYYIFSLIWNIWWGTPGFCIQYPWQRLKLRRIPTWSAGYESTPAEHCHRV